MSLKKLIEKRDIEAIRQFCKEHNLHIRDGKIVPMNEVAKTTCLEQAAFWDSRQQARKILLG